jgi:hypothetical protein
MKIEKLKISKNKIDINLTFYCFLKRLVKIKLSNQNILKIIEEYNLLGNNLILFIDEISDNVVKGKKDKQLQELLVDIKTEIDLKLFIFSLKLYNIRDALLQEAKIAESRIIQNLQHLDPLSLEYDKISVIKPYTTRVGSALLTLLFFEHLEDNKINFMSEDSINFLKELSKEFLLFKELGLESNQIFMLIMTETVNQSIISDSGSNYESRIFSVLTKNGIKNIKKIHDKDDKSTEFDFFFEIEDRSFGIGAKRTLRERYKQFIKTAQTSKIDVMIEITLGTDLNEEKAKIIVNHGTYIFVSDEIYQEKEYLQKMDRIYSVKDLTLDTLKVLK